MNFVFEDTAQVSPKKAEDAFNFEAFKALLITNSEQNPGFVAVNPKILELNKAQFIVYTNLLKYRNNQTGCAFLRGSKVGFTERHMHRIFDSLEAIKMIRKVSPGAYFIEIQDNRGHLFPCFSRWFWNQFVPNEYLSFRLAVFLGITRLDVNSITLREMRDALKCRTTAILSASQSLKGLDIDNASIKQCIRFRWKIGERKQPQQYVNGGELPVKTGEKPVSPVTEIESSGKRIQPKIVSQMSAISSKPEKEDLTKVSQPSFSITGNFKEIGLPEKEIRVTKIEPEAECVREFQDILTPKEIQFLLVLSSLLLKQRQFQAKPVQDLIAQAVNLILVLKGKAARLKLNRSILDYFCGTLLVIMESNSPTFEVNRRRERAKERIELQEINASNEYRRQASEDKKELAARQIFDELKVMIDGWEAMSDAMLACKIGMETMSGGALFSAAQEIKARMSKVD